MLIIWIKSFTISKTTKCCLVSCFDLSTYSMCVRESNNRVKLWACPICCIHCHRLCLFPWQIINITKLRLAWHCLCCVDVLNSAELNAVHELSLCLTVPSSAWKWHRAGMNWKSEWLYEHKDRWQDPHWNVWPAHGCYLFSLSSSQQTHCDCGAAAVRFTSQAPRDCGTMHGRVTWAG